MNYEEVRAKQVQDAIVDSSEGRAATKIVSAKKIKSKERELYAYKKFNEAKEAVGKASKWAYKTGKKTFKKGAILRDQSRVTVDVSQPVYSKDKSRFFKTAWEEEKKQLFFS